jgi:PadR family transcriptional regulator, regulatory protein PadR
MCSSTDGIIVQYAFVHCGDADILRETKYVYMAITPLSESTYLVLGSLAEGPTHGYEIIQRARALSGGRVSLAVATLYTTLDRLCSRAAIELVSETIVDGRARRSYALTNMGSGLLGAETARMAQLVTTMTKRPRIAAVSAGVTQYAY